MILGVGCDLCEIERIERCAERLVLRCFSDREREMLKSRNDFIRSVAAGFAAKEAFAKALGTGVRGFSMRETEILRDGNGKPYIDVYGNAKKMCDERGITRIHVSLTHSRGLAMAYVITENG